MFVIASVREKFAGWGLGIPIKERICHRKLEKERETPKSRRLFHCNERCMDGSSGFFGDETKYGNITRVGKHGYPGKISNDVVDVQTQ